MCDQGWHWLRTPPSLRPSSPPPILCRHRALPHPTDPAAPTPRAAPAYGTAFRRFSSAVGLACPAPVQQPSRRPRRPWHNARVAPTRTSATRRRYGAYPSSGSWQQRFVPASTSASCSRLPFCGSRPVLPFLPLCETEPRRKSRALHGQAHRRVGALTAPRTAFEESYEKTFRIARTGPSPSHAASDPPTTFNPPLPPQPPTLPPALPSVFCTTA